MHLPVRRDSVESMGATFHLAPMTADLRIATWLLWALALGMGCVALATPFFVGAFLFATAAFMVLTYASVWLGFRPSRFVIEPEALTIEWPLRSRVIRRADIERARIVSAADFRREYGYGMRIGAGGLWGGFGLLKTGAETFSMWISRTDRYVIVTLRNDRPLLLTPTLPERFVELLEVTPAVDAATRGEG